MVIPTSSSSKAKNKRLAKAQENFERHWKKMGYNPATIRQRLAHRPGYAARRTEMFRVAG